MSQITDPAIVALAEPGETPWEGSEDDRVIMQRPCGECDRGLLYSPVRFCGPCSGSGFRTRIVVLTDPTERIDR